MADHRRHGRGGLDGNLLKASHAGGHRARDLSAQLPALGDHLQEVRGFEPQEPRWLGRSKAGERWRAQQQRDLAEIVAGTERREPMLPPGERLESVDPTLEQAEEGGGLALDEEVLVSPQAHVGRAGGE